MTYSVERWRKQLMFLLAGILLLATASGLWWALERAKRRAEKQNCLSNMVAINLAGRMWSNDHGDHMPRTLTEMSNELNTPKVLFCVADPEGRKLRVKVSSWDKFDEPRCSYEIVSPGISEVNSNNVFLRCKAHAHLGYVDGSVFNGEKRLSGYEAKFGRSTVDGTR